MSITSYAQNFEDVILWRALRSIKNGFYIDIGAQDPVIDSVSLAFYEHGWRGVHVEPTQRYANSLRKARPDEVVEQLAIGDSVESSLTFSSSLILASQLQIPALQQHTREVAMILFRSKYLLSLWTFCLKNTAGLKYIG